MADSPELEGLRAELEILRAANQALIRRNQRLSNELSRLERGTSQTRNQEQIDLLVSCWHLLKIAQKTLGRSTGAGELLAKIEGHVPKESLRGP